MRLVRTWYRRPLLNRSTTARNSCNAFQNLYGRTRWRRSAIEVTFIWKTTCLPSICIESGSTSTPFILNISACNCRQADVLFTDLLAREDKWAVNPTTPPQARRVRAVTTCSFEYVSPVPVKTAIYIYVSAHVPSTTVPMNSSETEASGQGARAEIY